MSPEQPRCLHCNETLPLPNVLKDSNEFDINFARSIVAHVQSGGRNIDPRMVTEALGRLVLTFDSVVQVLRNSESRQADLETATKIARSNLVLAEANAEALEETLRRRPPVPSTSTHTSTTQSNRNETPELVQSLWETDSAATSSPTISEHHATPNNNVIKEKSLSFWKRKKSTPNLQAQANNSPLTISNPSLPVHSHSLPPSVSLPLLSIPAARSIPLSSSPTTISLNDLPPLPRSPTDLELTSLDANHFQALQNENATLHSRISQLSAMLESERSLAQEKEVSLSGLYGAFKSLESTHASLKFDYEKRGMEILELKKSLENLQNEIETLSQALFEEANSMVADERKLRYNVEMELEDLKSQLEDMRKVAEQQLELELGLVAPTDYDGPPTARPLISKAARNQNRVLNSQANEVDNLQQSLAHRDLSPLSPQESTAIEIELSPNSLSISPLAHPNDRNSPTVKSESELEKLESPVVNSAGVSREVNTEQHNAPTAGRQWFAAFSKKLARTPTDEGTPIAHIDLPPISSPKLGYFEPPSSLSQSIAGLPPSASALTSSTTRPLSISTSTTPSTSPVYENFVINRRDSLRQSVSSLRNSISAGHEAELRSKIRESLGNLPPEVPEPEIPPELEQSLHTRESSDALAYTRQSFRNSDTQSMTAKRNSGLDSATTPIPLRSDNEGSRKSLDIPETLSSRRSPSPSGSNLSSSFPKAGRFSDSTQSTEATSDELLPFSNAKTSRTSQRSDKTFFPPSPPRTRRSRNPTDPTDLSSNRTYTPSSPRLVDEQLRQELESLSRSTRPTFKRRPTPLLHVPNIKRSVSATAVAELNTILNSPTSALNNLKHSEEPNPSMATDKSLIANAFPHRRQIPTALLGKSGKPPVGLAAGLIKAKNSGTVKPTINNGIGDDLDRLMNNISSMSESLGFNDLDLQRD